MNFKLTLYMVGILNLFLALAMTAPLVVAHIYQDGTGDDFLISILLTVAASLLMILLCRKQSKEEVRHREGMAVVALGWFVAGLFGALPFYLAGTFPNYLDCLFEALSGFTTTGASVMTAIEGNPQGILFWRSLTHWLGGMGIIVLTIAICLFWAWAGCSFSRPKCRDRWPINSSRGSPRPPSFYGPFTWSSPRPKSCCSGWAA